MVGIGEENKVEVWRRGSEREDGEWRGVGQGEERGGKSGVVGVGEENIVEVWRRGREREEGEWRREMVGVGGEGGGIER